MTWIWIWLLSQVHFYRVLQGAFSTCLANEIAYEHTTPLILFRYAVETAKCIVFPDP